MKLIKITKLIILAVLITLTFTFETATESEDKMKNKINISEGNMKHKKIHLRNLSNEKLYSSTAVAGTAASAATGTKTAEPTGKNSNYMAVSTNSDIGRNSNLLQVSAGISNPIPNELKLGDGPIFFEGWMKYFKYADLDQSSNSPKQFFKNNYYYEQMKELPQMNMNATASDGTLFNVKSPSHFYVVVFKNNVNFLSRRMVQLQKTVDTLYVENIKPVIESKSYGEISPANTNGIQDFGNFSEGFCLKVLSSKPRGETWIICADSDQDKTNFMNVVKQLKILNQRDKGELVMPAPKSQDTISDMLNPAVEMGQTKQMKTDEKGNLSVGADEKTSVVDGYWIVLQDWTQCSLKCGGGTSTLQRMCVPPKNQGVPCEGAPVLTRPCNPQPCPNVYGTDLLHANNSTRVMSPIVKVMPFSTRPQRYSKCIIKESDLMFTKDNERIEDQGNPLLRTDPNKLPKMQIPVRVVMNNQTLTIFSGDSYDSQIKTFALKDTFFKRSTLHKTCFILTSSSKTAELCPFGFSSNNGKMIEEWDYDFNLFKYQCATPRDKVEVAMDDQLNKKLQNKIQNAKKELLEERENEIKKGVEKDEANQMDKVIKTTNQVALQAIQKELNLEAMIKQEESEREQKEELDMLKKIEEEKKKTECFMKAIKERELENQYNLRAKEAEDEISSIKQAASQQVLIRRSQLKNQIVQMRKKAQRRKAKLAKELLSVRNVMAETMGKVSKKGDISRCTTALKSQNDKNNYCQANYPEDYNGLQNCKEADEFCTLCCDNEFGELNVNDRQSCYKAVCTAEKSSASGKWTWQDGAAKR
jgi:hypothetical protein